MSYVSMLLVRSCHVHIHEAAQILREFHSYDKQNTHYKTMQFYEVLQ